MKQKLRNRLFSETKVQVTALFFCVCILTLGTYQSHAQLQAHTAITDNSELTLSEKTLQVLYDLSKLTPSTELPESYFAAYQKISTDFPYEQALGSAFNKSAVHNWLRTNPKHLEEIYALLADYYSQLATENQPVEQQPKSTSLRR
jgi:hypothetical protein